MSLSLGGVGGVLFAVFGGMSEAEDGSLASSCGRDAGRVCRREDVEGPEGWFLTADRPVINPWRRLRLARAFAGPCVADMETAAAAAVAARAGVPWAALRAVTDVPGWTGPVGSGSFRKHFPTQAGRAADSVPDLLAALLP